MKILVVTVAAIALSTVSGHAQQNNQTPWASLPSMKDEPSNHADEHSNAPKADEKAYRSALDAIPPIKGDPWHSVREGPKSKSPR